MLAGCSISQRIDPEQLQRRVDASYAQMVSDYTDIRRITIQVACDKLDAWLGGQRDEPPTIDILILSSGGPDGAFGAGVLEGWGQIEDPDLRRPMFDRVRGISTGALMAPYAMVGTDVAYHNLAEFYANPDPDWASGSMLWSVIVGSDSLLNNDALQQTVRVAINRDMIDAIAERRNENAIMLVGATNMDLGRFRIFDLTSVAATGDEERFENIMLASAAIPGVFPPVEIDGWAYGDGGAVANLFLGVDRDLVWREGGGPWWTQERINAGVPKLRVRHWIIVNNKLSVQPAIAERNWGTLARLAISQILRAASIQSLQQLDVMRRLAAQRPDVEFEVYWVAIPDDAVLPESEDIFDPNYMRALVELGRRVGADPTSWRTESPLLELDWEQPVQDE